MAKGGEAQIRCVSERGGLNELSLWPDLRAFIRSMLMKFGGTMRAVKVWALWYGNTHTYIHLIWPMRYFYRLSARSSTMHLQQMRCLEHRRIGERAIITTAVWGRRLGWTTQDPASWRALVYGSTRTLLVWVDSLFCSRICDRWRSLRWPLWLALARGKHSALRTEAQ